jgi:hypothetical protein
MNINIFKHYPESAEALHRTFFVAHDKLVAALAEFTKALRLIQSAEENRETREKAKQYRAIVEKFRDAAETLLSDAGRFRTDLLGETGCDGSCHK